MRIQKKEYVEEQGPILEDGERYDATLKGFGEFEGQYGPQLVWQFEIVTEDGEVVEAAAFTSYSMASGKKKSNLIKYTEAILGEIPDEGIDQNDLLGKPCRVDVATYESSKQTAEGEVIIKNKVVDVKPPKKGQKAAKIEKAPASGKQEVDLNEEDFNDLPF